MENLTRLTIRQPLGFIFLKTTLYTEIQKTRNILGRQTENREKLLDLDWYPEELHPGRGATKAVWCLLKYFIYFDG